MSHEVQIDRHVSREHNLLLAHGVFGPLFADYLEHSRRWVGDPDGLVGVMMRQGLAAVGLYLTCRPLGEETAWTLNLPEPPLNLFFVADSARSRVVGRYFDRHVRSQGSSRLIVQRVQGDAKRHQSIIEVTGFDVLLILERFYIQSEQTSARFFEYEGDEFLMLMALPGLDEQWLCDLDSPTARALVDAPTTRHIETRPIVFGCACDRDRLLDLSVSLFSRLPEDLFRGQPGVEILCPRCGRAYDIDRPSFERRREEKQRSPDGEKA